MKHGIPYLLLALLFTMISNHLLNGYALVKNDLIVNLAGSLGSLFGSFILAGFVVGYLYLPKRKFVGFNKWNLITLIVSLLVIGWQFYGAYANG